jgi:hypothetical protein
MNTSNSRAISSVHIDQRDRDKPRVDVILGGGHPHDYLWIATSEHGTALLVQIENQTRRFPSEGAGTAPYGPVTGFLQRADGLIERAEPLARSIIALLQEINRASPPRSGRSDFRISHINIQAWIPGPMIDIILTYFGEPTGLISMTSDEGRRFDLREIGGLNRQLDATPHSEALADIVSIARPLEASARALAEQVQQFIGEP